MQVWKWIYVKYHLLFNSFVSFNSYVQPYNLFVAWHILFRFFHIFMHIIIFDCFILIKFKLNEFTIMGMGV